VPASSPRQPRLCRGSGRARCRWPATFWVSLSPLGFGCWGPMGPRSCGTCCAGKPSSSSFSVLAHPLFFAPLPLSALPRSSSSYLEHRLAQQHLCLPNNPGDQEEEFLLQSKRAKCGAGLSPWVAARCRWGPCPGWAVEHHSCCSPPPHPGVRLAAPGCGVLRGAAAI